MPSSALSSDSTMTTSGPQTNAPPGWIESQRWVDDAVIGMRQFATFFSKLASLFWHFFARLFQAARRILCASGSYKKACQTCKGSVAMVADFLRFSYYFLDFNQRALPITSIGDTGVCLPSLLGCFSSRMTTKIMSFPWTGERDFFHLFFMSKWTRPSTASASFKYHWIYQDHFSSEWKRRATSAMLPPLVSEKATIVGKISFYSCLYILISHGASLQWPSFSSFPQQLT